MVKSMNRSLLAITMILVGSVSAKSDDRILPPIAPPTSTVHIIVMVKYCMKLNPSMCRTLSICPADGHETVSIPECNKGVMSSSAVFTLEGIEWYTRGGVCKEEYNSYAGWKQLRSE